MFGKVEDAQSGAGIAATASAKVRNACDQSPPADSVRRGMKSSSAPEGVFHERMRPP